MLFYFIQKLLLFNEYYAIAMLENKYITAGQLHNLLIVLLKMFQKIEYN